MIFYENSKPLVSLQEISNISEQLQLREFKFLGSGDLADMYTRIYTLDQNRDIDHQLKHSIVTFDHLVLGAR